MGVISSAIHGECGCCDSVAACCDHDDAPGTVEANVIGGSFGNPGFGNYTSPNAPPDYFNDYLDLSVFGAEYDTVTSPAMSTTVEGIDITITGTSDFEVRRVAMSITGDMGSSGDYVLYHASAGGPITFEFSGGVVCNVGIGISAAVNSTQTLDVEVWDDAAGNDTDSGSYTTSVYISTESNTNGGILCWPTPGASITKVEVSTTGPLGIAFGKIWICNGGAP